MLNSTKNGYSIIDELIRDPFFNNKIRHVKTVEPRNGNFVPMDRLKGIINERLLTAFSQKGIPQLYEHQYEAISSVIKGNDVALATPTASGKTLVYNLCVLNSYLTEPTSKALYIFPLKALAQDQLKNLTTLSRILDIPIERMAATYDGDTPVNQRKIIRKKSPAIVITNPDMLHFSILSNHHKWEEFLKNVRYVVVDEVHTYRGIFGSNVANIFRRLERILKNREIEFRYICTSATMTHTREFLETLMGRKMKVFEKSSAPSAKKHFLFINPAMDMNNSALSASATTTARNLLASFIEAGKRTICFTQSRKQAELIAKWTREMLPPGKRELVEPYRAGYLPEDRRRLEREMASGKLLGIVSTSALELGIDIGHLESCILAGYPGTMISTWQRAGRVGRKGSGGNAYISFIAGQDALDQYMVNHADELFNGKWENAVIDPENPHLLDPHILCAANELPIPEKEIGSLRLFPLSSVFKLGRERQLRKVTSEVTSHYVTDISRPHRRIDIRNMGFNFQILGDDGKPLGDIDNRRVFHECHPEAIYLHRGNNFVVEKLDILRHAVRVARTESPNHTSPKVVKSVNIVRVFAGKSHGPLKIYFGDLRIEEQVVGFYEKSSGPKSAVLREKDFDEPMPKQVLNTKGIWFTLDYGLPGRIQEKVGGETWEILLTPEPITITDTFMGAIHGAEHNLISMLPIFAMCDRWDVGGLSTLKHPGTLLPTIFVYDGIEGGMGFVRKGFDMAKEWIISSTESLRDCKCVEDNGCPSCIQSPKCGNNNTPLHRKGASMVMEYILGELEDQDGSDIDVNTIEIRRVTGESTERESHEETSPEEGWTGTVSERTEELLKKGIVIFDLETEKLAHEVGGWNNIKDMGMSIAFTYDTATGRYSRYDRSNIEEMFNLLYDAPLVVGFNLLNFDWEVLAGFPNFDSTRISCLDLFKVIRGATRRRIALNNLGKNCVGMEKTGDGFKAIEWLRSGQMDKLDAYCKRDVEITFNLFLYILENGNVKFEVPEFGHVVKVEVDLWREVLKAIRME